MAWIKNKKIVFTIITVAMLLIFFVGNYYVREAYASAVYHSNYYQALNQLYSGDVIEQNFVMREGDEGVSVILGTYVTTLGGGNIEAELFDEEGDKVAETVTDLTGHADNYGARIYFGKLDEELYGKTLKLRMTFVDIDDQLVTVYGSITDLDKYQATLNGESLGWNITMDGIRKTYFVEFRDFRNFFVGAFGIIAAYLALFVIKWKEIKPRKMVEDALATVKGNWKKIAITFGVMILSAILGNFFEGKISAESAYTNPYRAYAIAVGLFVIAFATIFYKYIWKHVHVYVLILVMLVGSVYIMGQPPVPVSHDEQLHYTNTSYVSWGATTKISASDYYVLARIYQQHYYNIFQKDQRAAWADEVNIVDGEGHTMPYATIMNLASVPYFITGIALYVFRVLGVEFITRYLLGKFVNLFIYAGCFALAIKLIPGRGKLILSMVALIPTNIIMASSYGCDWWIIAFVALGFAIFIRELQLYDKISTKKFALSTAVIALGMFPKAVYFPVLFPMMLMKKERYENSKKCRIITVIGAIVLVLSFVLPLVISVDTGGTAGGGDIRGGSDVNAAGQIAFILGNFDVYLKVLFGYMREYLDPDKMYAIMNATAYQGRGPFFTACLMTLAVAAALDNTDKPVFKNREVLAVLGNYIGNFGAVVLVITALYVGYTPVGMLDVKGCQPRYLLPILFPFLYFAGENKLSTSEELKGKAFVWGAITMMIVAILTINDTFLIKY